MIRFHTTRERIVTDIISFTEKEFIKTLIKNKPTEIFNDHYSYKVPCWIITEYLEDNKVKYFASGWADKTPVEIPMKDLYRGWLIQGLSESYIK